MERNCLRIQRVIKKDDIPYRKLRIHNQREEEDPLGLRQDTNEIDDDFVFYFTPDNKDDYFVEPLSSNDRWIVAAAHCYNDLSEASNKNREIKINTIRDNTTNKELIEMKKSYTTIHTMKVPLYDDIAVVELGRRIVYDYMTSLVTHHSAWTRREKTFYEETATVQATASPRMGRMAPCWRPTSPSSFITSSVLEQFESNITDTKNKDKIVSELCKALPFGLNDGLLVLEESRVG